MAIDRVNHEIIEWKQARMRRRGELPRVFAVVTWGCTATTWLAKVLNSHPEIFCVHSIRGQFRLLTSSIDQASDVDLLSVIRILASGHHLVGDVHGIRQKSVPSLMTAFGNEIRVAGLIREPLKRLRSQYSLFLNANDASAPPRDLSHIQRLDGYPDIEIDVADNTERLGFVDAANLLNTIFDEVRSLPRIFRHEDITRIPNSFAELIEYLSGDTIKVEPEFAARAIATPRLNRHDRSPECLEFEPWQVRVVKAIVKPQAWQLYKEFGYDAPAFALQDGA